MFSVFIKPKSRKCIYLISLCSEITYFHDPNLPTRKAGNLCASRMRKTHGEYLALCQPKQCQETLWKWNGRRENPVSGGSQAGYIQEGVYMKIQNLKIYVCNIILETSYRFCDVDLDQSWTYIILQARSHWQIIIV